jgi:hypothetical protein
MIRLELEDGEAAAVRQAVKEAILHHKDKVRYLTKTQRDGILGSAMRFAAQDHQKCAEALEGVLCKLAAQGADALPLPGGRDRVAIGAELCGRCGKLACVCEP